MKKPAAPFSILSYFPETPVVLNCACPGARGGVTGSRSILLLHLRLILDCRLIPDPRLIPVRAIALELYPLKFKTIAFLSCLAPLWLVGEAPPK